MSRTEIPNARARAYAHDGFVLERGLLAATEVDSIDDAFMSMHAYQPGTSRRHSTRITKTASL
jgi:hypothetical protein